MKRLSDVLQSELNGRLNQYSGLVSAWKSAAGDIIFMMTTVMKLSDGCLLVAVHDKTWLAELNFLKGEILNKLEGCGQDIRSVSFYYKFRKSAPLVHTAKKSMSQKEKEYADRLVSDIKDPELRESFRRAIYSYFTVYSLDDYLA